MKKNIITTAGSAVFLFSMVLVFSSCLKDSCRHTYTLYAPVYEKLSALRAAVQHTAATPVVNTGKLFISGSWIFLNEQNKGIHIIDNSNPAHPVNTGFINIPGNADITVKDNILYADLYCDLAAIDISKPGRITVTKFLTNTFPEKSSNPNSDNPDAINVITGWSARDTTVDCSIPGPLYMANASLQSPAAAPVAAASGTAGSMARFASVNNYMYAVTTSNLNVINVSEAANPVFVQRKNIGWNIETIFPFNNKLYVGAGNSMSVYDLQNPTDPQQLSWNGHWCSGDPVVADDNFAYVTLHQANICGSSVNELQVYDLSAANTPLLVKNYAMVNPQGLSKDGSLLFVCDEGLKIYDATNAGNLTLINHFSGMETYDVIATGGIAYLVAKDGLYQYDYSNPQNIHRLSKLVK